MRPTKLGSPRRSSSDSIEGGVSPSNLGKNFEFWKTRKKLKVIFGSFYKHTWPVFEMNFDISMTFNWIPTQNFENKFNFENCLHKFFAHLSPSRLEQSKPSVTASRAWIRTPASPQSRCSCILALYNISVLCIICMYTSPQAKRHKLSLLRLF